VTVCFVHLSQPLSSISGLEKTEILEVFTIGFCAAQGKVSILGA